MKLIIPLLAAVLPALSVAQSPSESVQALPSVAIPKTTAVLVIQTPKQGVTPQQIMAVMPEEILATVKLYFDGKSDSGIRAAMAKGSSSSSTQKPRERHDPSWKCCRSRKNI